VLLDPYFVHVTIISIRLVLVCLVPEGYVEQSILLGLLAIDQRGWFTLCQPHIWPSRIMDTPNTISSPE
jgi:hypothetical protein